MEKWKKCKLKRWSEKCDWYIEKTIEKYLNLMKGVGGIVWRIAISKLRPMEPSPPPRPWAWWPTPRARPSPTWRSPRPLPLVRELSPLPLLFGGPWRRRRWGRPPQGRPPRRRGPHRRSVQCRTPEINNRK